MIGYIFQARSAITHYFLIIPQWLVGLTLSKESFKNRYTDTTQTDLTQTGHNPDRHNPDRLNLDRDIT